MTAAIRLGAEGALNMGAYQDLASHRPLARGGGLGGSWRKRAVRQR